MSILLLAPGRDSSGLLRQLHRLDPAVQVYVWPDAGPADQIDFAACWNPPSGILARFPALKAVTSLGAGVDSLLSDQSLPPALPIGRLSGPRLAADLGRWLVARVSAHWQRMDRFKHQQAEKQWKPWAPDQPPRIGLLGMGQTARRAAAMFTALGMPVAGWSRSGKGPEGVMMHSGQSGLLQLAAEVDFLICLLPLTRDTRDILNRALFNAMSAHAVLINAGRGQHLVESDLIEALDNNQLAGAILDVFRVEPLTVDHPFWTHPLITVSPHCAGLSRDGEVAELLLESYRRVSKGQPPLGAVDRSTGY